MARTSRQEWSKRVERWADSGLTAREFAAELGVNPHTLAHWKWLLRSESSRTTKSKRTPMRRGATKSQSLPFVELARSAISVDGFEVVLATGTTVRVPAHFDADALGQLLGVLGRTSCSPATFAF